MGGWVLAKKVEREIEKCGRMWQEDFLLLILCDFVYMCIYKGYRRIPSYSLDLVPFLKMIELFKVVSFEGIFRSIHLTSSGRKKNFHSLENSLDLCFLDVGKGCKKEEKRGAEFLV